MENTHDFEIRIKTNSVLFFDLDGTLVNTDLANFLSYKKAIQSVLGSKIEISFNAQVRLNRSSIRNLFPDLTEKDLQEIIQKKELFYKEYIHETQINKLVIDILTRYSKTNTTILVTNCRKDRALMTLKYHGLTDNFNRIFHRQISGGETKINKYQKAINSLNISPDSVIVFENEEPEINDAINAGIPSKNILNL